MRKREARKKRKLEEGKDSEGGKIAQERNKVIKAENSSNLSSSKAKKFKNLSRMDVTQSESKRGKKNVGRKKNNLLWFLETILLPKSHQVPPQMLVPTLKR